jgi:hypothetical protein
MVRFVVPLLLPLVLSGCLTDAAIGPAAAVEIGSTMVLGRGPIAAAYSVLSGRDCSLPNYAAEGRFCRQEEAPNAPRYCTRSLGYVDCWTVVDPFGPQRGVADLPRPPPQQHRRWVDLRPERQTPVTETPRQASE